MPSDSRLDVIAGMFDLLGYGALVLEMNLPPVSTDPPDEPTCHCYHPHDECETCGCAVLAAAEVTSPAAESARPTKRSRSA